MAKLSHCVKLYASFRKEAGRTANTHGWSQVIGKVAAWGKDNAQGVFRGDALLMANGRHENHLFCLHSYTTPLPIQPVLFCPCPWEILALPSSGPQSNSLTFQALPKAFTSLTPPNGSCLIWILRLNLGTVSVSQLKCLVIQFSPQFHRIES